MDGRVNCLTESKNLQTELMKLNEKMDVLKVIVSLWVVTDFLEGTELFLRSIKDV